jgi:hypothetical protein
VYSLVVKLHRAALGNFSACFIAATVLAVFVASAAAVQTTGIYDENVVQPNSVDQTLAGSTFSAADFATLVAQAFNDNRGGVIDGTIQSSNYDYGIGGAKSVRLQTGPFNSFGGIVPNPPLPISGIAALASSQTYAPLELDVSQLEGAVAADERVTAFGVTILASARGSTPQTTHLKVQAYFGDGTRSALEYNIGGDTFLSFQAPPGESISRVKFTTNVNGFYFDDVGFITGPAQASSIRFSTVTPSAWAEAVVMPGNTFDLTQNPDSINIRRDRFGVTSHGIVEIPIGQIPAGATIREVEFGFNPSIAPLSSPVSIAFYGYVGDGIIESADAARTMTFIGRLDVQGNNKRVVQIDPAFGQSLLAGATHLGLVAVMESNQSIVAWTNVFDGPLVQVTYTIPEPSAFALLMVVAAMGSARRQR